MSKKGKDKKRPQGKSNIFQFRDLTAERHLQAQMAKALQLYEEKRFDKVLELLEPLVEKHSKYPDLLELLGICYAKLGLASEALKAFEDELKLVPANKSVLVRYNLAQLYLKSGFPALALEQTNLIDCAELSQLTGQLSELGRCFELKETTQKASANIASENGQSFEHYEKIAPFLDRGRLFMERGHREESLGQFQTVFQLDPKNVVAHNNLALLYTLKNELDKALEECRIVLEELDPNNWHALCNRARVYVEKGDRAGAQRQLEEIRLLPVPSDPIKLLKLAEVYGFLEEDEHVFKLISPLVDNPEIAIELDNIIYQEAIIFTVVSAANQGKVFQAREILRGADEFEHSMLLDRLDYALENNEVGPLPQGRFFYTDPSVSVPDAYTAFQKLADTTFEGNSDSILSHFKRFLEEYGDRALELFTYFYWMSQEPHASASILILALESGVNGTEEMVRRLAFTRTGEDPHRVGAAGALAMTGRVSSEEQVSIWLGARLLTGKLEEVLQKYKRQVEWQAELEAVIYPSNISAMMQKGAELLQAHNAEEAIVLFRQILEKNPDVKQAYHNIAVALDLQNKLEEALECLEQAVERFPDYTQARLSLVRMLAQLGRVEEAAAQLEELSGLVDVMPMVLLKSYYLAQITLYQTQERFQELEKVLNQLQDIDPDNEWAEQLLAILKTVNTFAPGGYFWEMKEQYRQKRFKQWGKVLSREANIINLVQLFTKEELYALLAAWHCSDNRSNLRKEEMKQLVLDLLIGDLTYPVKELLTYEDRVALNALLEFGGYTSYEEWQQKAGFEDTLLKESPYVSKLQLYQKLPGRLLNLGFVFIGQPEKTLVAAIPIDMRIRLKEALEAL